jgi:hypothetical protein
MDESSPIEPAPIAGVGAKQKSPSVQYRFGIGEWYGKSFVQLSPEDRRGYAALQLQDSKATILCPFLSKPGKPSNCWKPGGICSLRSYEHAPTTDLVQINSSGSTFRTTCPSRFEQSQTIYKWIGESLLNSSNAVPVGEIPFLQRVPKIGDDTVQVAREVGRIDNVLVLEKDNSLEWCPVEKQAVYFSGLKMAHEFKYIVDFQREGLPFPQFNRRPDYRSSGPKRLLPQLQVKVPTLRTWGKKMAVVVDEDFFKELGNVNQTNHLSNAEVVWFVVRFREEKSGAVELEPSRIFMTTLDDSIKALVAAIPVPRPQFEAMLKAKIKKG